MSLKLFQQSPNMPSLEYTADASVAFTAGNLAYRDTSTGEIKEGTSTVLNIEGVVRETKTTAASNPRIELQPILHGPQQLWIADTTANTAANQLNKAHDMTSASAVDNTSTHDGTTAGVFVAVATVGAAADKKLIGYFLKIGQVTA